MNQFSFFSQLVFAVPTTRPSAMARALGRFVRTAAPWEQRVGRKQERGGAGCLDSASKRRSYTQSATTLWGIQGAIFRCKQRSRRIRPLLEAGLMR